MIFPRVLPVFCIFLLCLLGCSAANNDAVGVEDLHARITNNESPVVLDVRSQKEFDKGHIEGAIHIPIKQLPKQLSQLADKQDQPIIVYCHAGPRARKAIKLLQQSDFSQVVELEGHYQAWTKAGLPLVE